jgi:hypothetical protein
VVIKTWNAARWLSKNFRESKIAGLGVSAGHRVQTAAHGLANGDVHQNSHHEAGQTQRQEGAAPSVQVGHGAGHIRTQPGADRCAQGQHREGHGTALGGEAIRQDGGRRRQAPGFAHAHADAAEKKLPVGARHAAEHGESRPEHQGRSQDVASIGAIREPGNGQAEAYIEQCQGNTGQKGDPGIAQVKL